VIDTGVHRHEDAPKQLAYMGSLHGITPMQALQAATVNGADIIAMQGDPLADV